MSIIVTENITTSGAAIPNAALTDETYVYVPEGIRVISTSSSGISSSQRDLFVAVDGLLLGSSYGMTLDGSIGNGCALSVMIGSSGRVTGISEQGVRLAAVNDILGGTIGTNRMTLNNAGEIASLDESAVYVGGAQTAQIVNSGLIRSAPIDPQYGQHGVVVSYVTDLDLINTGRIESNGLSTTVTMAAIWIENSVSDAFVRNHGTLVAREVAYVSNATTRDALHNFGTISGDVEMSNTATSVLRNFGTIDGNIDLRSGFDRYVGSAGSVVTGTVSGGAGDDLLIGGNGIDIFRGGSNNDRLHGFGGDDSLFGDSGNDMLRGMDGDDSLFGSDGNDLILGGNGDDMMSGGADRDTLIGGTGNDTLAGDQGRDTLTGGAGEDVFRFASVTHSGLGVFERDHIADFTRGQDRIDLGALTGPALAFNGTAALSGAGGSVRYVQTASLTIIDIDVTGDGVRDMQIELARPMELTASDFIL